MRETPRGDTREAAVDPVSVLPQRDDSSDDALVLVRVVEGSHSPKHAPWPNNTTHPGRGKTSVAVRVETAFGICTDPCRAVDAFVPKKLGICCHTSEAMQSRSTMYPFACQSISTRYAGQDVPTTGYTAAIVFARLFRRSRQEHTSEFLLPKHVLFPPIKIASLTHCCRMCPIGPTRGPRGLCRRAVDGKNRCIGHTEKARRGLGRGTPWRRHRGAFAIGLFPST